MNYENSELEVHAGDYIVYTYKNELGKIKRLAEGNRVFAWFHTGDTASGIDTFHFTLILSDTVAKAMPEEELLAYLKGHGFSNAYAIEAIVDKS